MQKRIGLIRAGEVTAAQIAAYSRSLLDRPLLYGAELQVAVAGDVALLLGAFQRSAGVISPGEQRPVARRGSGGPEVLLAPATIHVTVALSHPAALGPCDEKRIVNRLVRPLLRALTKAGCLAHFFGRDWISVSHRPAAWVGFAHDAGTRRTAFEAFVAVRSPFAASTRASFLGKDPFTLEAALARPLDTIQLMSAIVDAYAGAYDVEPVDVAAPALAEEEDNTRAEDPHWTATSQEPIGLLGAGIDARGVFRVGGDLLVSRDALLRLEARAADADEADLARITNETLGAPGVALDGIRSLTSVRDLIDRARRQV